MMNTRLIVLGTLVALALGGGMSALLPTTAIAAGTEACQTNMIQKQIDASGSAWVKNLSDQDCTFYLASYEINWNANGSWPFINWQKLHTWSSITLGANEAGTLNTSVPQACEYQLDLVNIPPIEPPTYAPGYFLGVQYGGPSGVYCNQETPPVAPTADIKANGQNGPITIPYNTAAQITWTSDNTTSCTITPGNWNGTSGTNTTGNLTGTQTYTLTCTGTNGQTATDTVTVNVEQAPSNQTVTLTPGASCITPNTQAAVNWTRTGTGYARDWVVLLPTNGSWNTIPAAQRAWSYLNNSQTAPGSVIPSPGTVSLTAPSGISSYQFVFYENDTTTEKARTQAIPTCIASTINADIKAANQDGPITIPYNTAAQITWTSQNATACTVTPGNFTGISGATSTGNLTSAQTYFLSCTNNQGQSAQDSVVVNVGNQQQTPTADIKANNQDGPITITYGTSATISWNSQNTSYCSVAPTGWIGPMGSQLSGNLYASQTYTLTCTGTNGQTVTDQVVVNVGTQSQITADIKANAQDGPITINYNTPATLSWTSGNATTCTVNPGGFTGISGATSTGNLTVTQVYTLFCTNNQGQSAQDTVTVNVTPNQNNNNPTVDIKANGQDGTVNVSYGSIATISWNSQNTNYCSVSPNGWIGTSSSQPSGAVYGTQTYTATCTGTNGQTVTDSVTVTTQQNTILPTVVLTANPSVIPQGQSSNLSWTSQNATTCYATQGTWSGTKPINGGEQVYPAITTTYTITCSNSYGTAADSETIIVQPYNTCQYGNCYPQQGSLTITKSVRNITTGQQYFAQQTEAQGLDNLEFEIRVRNNGNTSITTTVQDLMPQELFYVSGSTIVNGVSYPDGIAQGGLTIGNLNPGEERIIRFRAVVFQGVGIRTVVNQATANGQNGYGNATAQINIRPRGSVLGAADIVTGPSNTLMISLTMGLLGALLLHWIAKEKGLYNNLLGDEELSLEERLRKLAAKARS